jgi:xanthine dehydrogenase/oxidase
MHDMLRWFASTQIRNVACLGGNLVTASPISDMNPMLAVLGATLVLAAYDEETAGVARRSVAVSDFFLKYRTVDLKSTELVERIEVPIVKPLFEYVIPFKQARRREDDISIVTSGMRICLAVNDGRFIIKDIAIAFGGMAPTTVMAVKTMEALKGAEFSAESFTKASETLLSELKLPEEVPGGQAAFRMALTTSFLYKFYLSVCEELKSDCEEYQADPSAFPNVLIEGSLPSVPEVDEKELTGKRNFLSGKKPSPSGTQFYPAPKVVAGYEDAVLPKVKPMALKGENPVGQGTVHMSGALHCTGEALYTDDVPLPPTTLQAALVLSQECGRILESIDVTPALGIPGVVAVYTLDDLLALGGKNELGPIVKDEVLFLAKGEKVGTIGQCLGICVAESLEAAELGARTVNVVYSGEAGKAVVSIADAIEADQFYEFSRHMLIVGDTSVLDSLANAESSGEPKVGDVVTVSGTFHSGAQEHFYLETMSTLVVPSESSTNLTIYASTQAPTKTQNFAASATGTPAAKVVVRVKRMGGGFGGKETRTVFASCATAVAAKASGRPVRLTLSRDVDMSITGTR